VWQWSTHNTTNGHATTPLETLLGPRTPHNKNQWDQLADLVATTISMLVQRQLHTYTRTTNNVPQMPHGAASTFVVDSELGTRTPQDLDLITQSWETDHETKQRFGTTAAKRARFFADPPDWVTSHLTTAARAGELQQPTNLMALADTLWAAEQSKSQPKPRSQRPLKPHRTR